jgi:hypothetical protein
LGFISNQWLKGDSVRDRGFSPVEVKLEWMPSLMEWHKQNNVQFTVIATRAGGDQHYIDFTGAELQSLLPRVLNTDASSREDVAIRLLTNLSNLEFAEIMAKVFARRANIARGLLPDG